MRELLDPFWISYLGLGALCTVVLGLGALCTVVELLRPAHVVRYRKTIPFDVITFAVVQLAMVPLAVAITEPAASYIPQPRALLDVWLPLRVVLFYLCADLGSYWMHRLMHTRHVWRVHRFHHSSTELYWLSGVRLTIPQQLLFNVPTVAMLPLLIGAPPWLIAAMLIEGAARNHWMHTNVTWRSNWLEWIFVTPRYHQIHHSIDGELHDANYGSLFTFWDRLFHTYVDPDVHQPKKFGTGEKKKRDPILMMIGI